MAVADDDTRATFAAQKEQGNALFRKGEYLKAAAAYTKCVREWDKLSKSATDEDRVAAASVHSNRSAAFLKLNKVQKALADAKTCTELRPDWEKGFYRLGEAHTALAAAESGDGGLQPSKEAVAAFEQAARLAPDNGEIAKRLKEARTPKLASKSAKQQFAFPKAQHKPPPPEWSEDALGKPDDRWLPALGRPAAMGGKDVERSPDFVAALVAAAEASNALGNWLGPYVMHAAKVQAGDGPWFFEAPAIARLMDDGLFKRLLDTLTHAMLTIIAGEASGDDPAARAVAEAGASLSHGCTGVLHNLMNPVLRAWSSRTTHMQLLGALMKVLEQPGTPITTPAGDVKPGPEMTKFLQLVSQIFGNAEAMSGLTGHALIMRVRLMLLRAHTNVAQGKDKAEWDQKAMACSRCLLFVTRVRAAAKWEAVLEELCTKEGAAAFHRQAAELNSQHELLSGAFVKFGFQNSVGI